MSWPETELNNQGLCINCRGDGDTLNEHEHNTGAEIAEEIKPNGEKDHLTNQHPEAVMSTDERARETIRRIAIPSVEVNLNKLKDLGKIKDNRKYFVKKVFDILTSPDLPTDPNSVQFHIGAYRCLENILSTQFKNTHDFKEKIARYLGDYDLRKTEPKERLKRARKKAGLTQKDLAALLGFKSQVSIAHIEEGKRYPPKKVLEWLEKQEI